MSKNTRETIWKQNKNKILIIKQYRYSRCILTLCIWVIAECPSLSNKWVNAIEHSMEAREEREGRGADNDAPIDDDDKDEG